MGFKKRWPVIFKDLGLLIKHGEAPKVTIAEGQCLWALRHLLPQVSVPEIYGWTQAENKTFLYMEFIDGITLNDLWNTLTLTEKSDVCAQLRTSSSEIQRLRQGPGDQFIGRCPAKVHRPGLDLADIPDPYREMLPDDVPIIFTHADFNLVNIMVSKESPCRLMAIIDWEQPGWYLAYWEFCKAEYTTELHLEWQAEYCQMFWTSRLVRKGFIRMLTFAP